MECKIGPRCGMRLSELAPDVESALDVENGPRLGTNPRSESNIYMRFNRPTTGRNYSDEQKVNFESPVIFSKCLRAKIYSNMNAYFDPKGC